MSSFSLFSSVHIARKYIFFDFETTGFNVLTGDRIIEIAMIKVENGQVLDTFETLVNPQRSIPEDASSVNNIYDKDVESSPIFDKSMADGLLQFIDDSTLVAHNATFDLNFLCAQFALCGRSFFNWQSIDTLKLAKQVFATQKNRLKNLIDRYKIKQTGDLHRAMTDTVCLQEVFFNLVDEEFFRESSLEDLVNNYGFKGNIHLMEAKVPAVIRNAMQEGEEVACFYRRRDGQIEKLTFIPLVPFWYNNQWFLLVNETKKGHIFLYPPHILGGP